MAQAVVIAKKLLISFKVYPSVYDFGMQIDTEADGLAVGTASRLVGKHIHNILSGCYTVTDKDLFIALYHLYQKENMAIEPSAAAGFMGPEMICNSREGKSYLKEHKLSGKMKQANHIIWTTGGGLVPENEFKSFYNRGEILSRAGA